MDSNIFEHKKHVKYLAIFICLMFAGVSILVFAPNVIAAQPGRLIIAVSAISLLSIAVTYLMDQYHTSQVLLTEIFHWH